MEEELAKENAGVVGVSGSTLAVEPPRDYARMCLQPQLLKAEHCRKLNEKDVRLTKLKMHKRREPHSKRLIIR